MPEATPIIQLTDAQAVPSNVDPQFTVAYVVTAGWESFKLHWLKLFKIQLIAILIAVAVVAALIIIMALTSGGFALRGWSPVLPIFITLISLLVVGALLLAAWVQLAQYLTLGGQSSQPMTESRRRMWGMAGVIVLVGLATLGGFILLFIPGIIVAVWFSQAAFVYAFENVGAVDSLKRSREHVRGRWWKVLGFLALPNIIVWMVSGWTQSYVSVIPGPVGPILLIIATASLQIAAGLYTTCYAYHLYLALKATSERPSAT